MTQKTKVAFRMFNGEVLAIMPEVPSTKNPYECTCYAHIGQHSGCDPYMVVERSRPATKTEYNGLKQELRRIGYRVEVIHRANRHAYLETRKAELKRA